MPLPVGAQAPAGWGLTTRPACRGIPALRGAVPADGPPPAQVLGLAVQLAGRAERDGLAGALALAAQMDGATARRTAAMCAALLAACADRELLSWWWRMAEASAVPAG
jgi:hypothetical protein